MKNSKTYKKHHQSQKQGKSSLCENGCDCRATRVSSKAQWVCEDCFNKEYKQMLIDKIK